MRALYISHTGMTEALGRSQVLPYVRGLAQRGWEFDLVAFEPADARVEEIESLAAALTQDGIRYRWLRRTRSPSLLVKTREIFASFAKVVGASLSHRPRIVHARSYLPALTAELARRTVPGCRFVFDCRGLLGDEYVDAGYWTRESARYRVLKGVERHLFGTADAVVSLTEALAVWLRREKMVHAERTIVVVPCCVDLSRFSPQPEARRRLRAQLGLDGKFVLAYSGTLGSYNTADEMAALFGFLRGLRPARFLLLTRSDPAPLREAFQKRGLPSDQLIHLELRPDGVNAHLAAADAGLCLAHPWFSKIAASPVKIPEYLALGLPVVVNRGIGDCDRLIARGFPLVDAGRLAPDELERAAHTLAALTSEPPYEAATQLAAEEFDLHKVGIARYAALYDSLR